MKTQIYRTFVGAKASISGFFYIIYCHSIKPKSTNEDIQRREFILNIILTSSLVCLTLFDGLIIYYSLRDRGAYPGIPFAAFSLIVIAFVLLLLLSRKGHISFAAHGVIWFYLLAASYGCYAYGANLQESLLSFVLVIAISSILISTWYSFFITIVISAIIATLWNLQISMILHPQWFWYFTLKPHHAFEFIVLLFLITVTLWLSNREIEKSLKRARSSEQELKKERDTLEQTIERRTEELRSSQLERMTQLYKFAEFGKLSSGILHDLMNPLTALSFTIQSIEENAAENSKIYIQKAIHTTKKIEQLVTMLQKQIKSQDVKVYFDPENEINQTIDILKTKLNKDNITIKFSPNQNVLLHANHLKFYQVILNLLSNAIDAFDINSANKPSLIKITTNYNIDQKNYQIIISDNGSGIKPEHLEHVFDPFFTTKEFEKGTGIGLSVAKHIIEEEFKGTIQIKSTITIGTTFTITIPIIHE